VRQFIKCALIPVAFLIATGTTYAGKDSDPRSDALTLYKILQKQDWKSLYHAAAFSDKVAKTMPSSPAKFAEDVQKGIDNSGGREAVDKLFAGMSNMAVGKAAITGSKADVPTSCDIELQGKTLHFKGHARMIKRGAAWKWDLTSTDNVEKATSSALQELIGKPVAKDPSLSSSVR